MEEKTVLAFHSRTATPEKIVAACCSRVVMEEKPDLAFHSSTDTLETSVVRAFHIIVVKAEMTVGVFRHTAVAVQSMNRRSCDLYS